MTSETFDSITQEDPVDLPPGPRTTIAEDSELLSELALLEGCTPLSVVHDWEESSVRVSFRDFITLRLQAARKANEDET